MTLHRRLALALLCAAGGVQAQADRFGADVDAQIGRHYGAVEALYKHLHANPELAFEEVNTAKRLAQELRTLGFEVTEGIGKTGVVGLLRNGNGPTVMVRTELDALPMEEKTGLPYASKVKTTYLGKESFVAHSCGHDLHMAAWVGTAKTLVGLKDRWQGTLMFIAQPAEETLGRRQGDARRRPVQEVRQARLRLRAAHLADGPRRHRLQRRRGDVELRRLRGRVPRPRRARLGAARLDRPGADRVALRRRCARRDQPREGPVPVRRLQRRLDPGRHQRQHHSRQRRAARHDPLVRPERAREDEGRHRAHREGCPRRWPVRPSRRSRSSPAAMR